MKFPIALKTAGRLIGFLVVFLAACTPRATPVPTATASSVALQPQAIRFALIGDVTHYNVWALFDSKGYSYNNYAVRSEYWPRLYRLSIPDGQFEPLAAAAMPSAVQPEGELFAATVPLRTNLTWTDGSPFTADDVAFTVNTAVSFRLGFDWQAYYDPDWLDHAEAVDASTVKFYFKRAPNVAVLQYGALQGPIVQKKYWMTKVAKASTLLPSMNSPVQIELLKTKVSDLQSRMDELMAESATATGDQVHQLQVELLHRQQDLDQAMSELSKAEASLDNAMLAGSEALYASDDKDEPTLGTWMPTGRQNGIWVNEANPKQPFGEAHFDRSTYTSFPDEASAIAAFNKGTVDVILEAQGIQAQLALDSVPTSSLVNNPTSSVHFLIINPTNRPLADPELRRALFCSIDRGGLARVLRAAPLTSFIPSVGSPWFNPGAAVYCGKGSDPVNDFDAAQAVGILKAAGYTWNTEPSGETPGVGLQQPNGKAIPPITLLISPEQADREASLAAQFIEKSAIYLGIPVVDQAASPSDVRFAVFNDGKYDLAILGWRLSAYPGYLCDWFGEGSAIHYEDDQVRAACHTLSSSSDLDSARSEVFQIQSVLADNLPFVPLFTDLTYDSVRGVRYAFEQVRGGISGVYGAPSLAMPALP
jgi:peptide/nickel transport system substrate-binding protein